ncbi:MAG: Hpy99I family type II restriction endonuclease [Paludibacteraceae bacterium]|jgi:RNase P subunit RPR2|nr:Hpy99I family type II restriction endonuclease [Paludibacteraceae bacterium]MBP9039377.1 Hpy99I family type II restriction endonuclease [Paludibacteraceae bacterium]HOA46729.1 endonuclease VII domain-containing protein [Paludibacteraceae bacterium]HOH70808.1 endonuclease VII domain-containing protein [Paludibacteraceae bacterium]HOO24475.1 endonuclease VII domain-containing protein [Paludibacteraceae bacterium]
MIKVNDFVVLTEKYKGLDKNSVGFVEKVTPSKAKVFFIGKNIEIDIDLSKIKFLDVTKTGKPYKYKICNVCHILKEDYKDFDINQTDAKGRKTTRPTCTECRKAIDGVALKKSKKNRMEAIRPEKFFICPICKKPSIPYVTANLVIDHDHDTGNAREWICDSCNTGLGRFKDSIELMQEAIKYLKRHAKNQKS